MTNTVYNTYILDVHGVKSIKDLNLVRIDKVLLADEVLVRVDMRATGLCEQFERRIANDRASVLDEVLVRHIGKLPIRVAHQLRKNKQEE